MPYKDKDVNREWDRRRNANDPARRFSNGIGRTLRAIRERMVLKRERIAQLEKELGIVSED